MAEPAAQPPTAPIAAYVPPEWSARPPAPFVLEVLKDGVMLETLTLPADKAYVSIGRLPTCDVPMEHASVSRYHAVLQFRDDGRAFLYDLGSTHGTRLNKETVPKKTFVPVPPGSFLRFGESSRSLILQPPPGLDLAGDKTSDQQLRSMVTGTLAARRQRQIELARQEQAQATAKPDGEDEGISWGMGADDGEDEEAQREAAAASGEDGKGGENDDDWYLRDPRKILRGWFDFHGERMEIVVEEDGPGHARVYNARLKLPIEDQFGTEVWASASAGRKKDAEREVILDACQKLNSRGVLRTDDPSVTAEMVEARKRRLKELYGDDDDDQDEFYDRTALKKAGKKGSATAQTYDSLMAQRAELVKRRDELQQLHTATLHRQAEAAIAQEEDDLDAYMDAIKVSLVHDDAAKVRGQLDEVLQELSGVERLINVARPTHIPTFEPDAAVAPAHELAAPARPPAPPHADNTFKRPHLPASRVHGAGQGGDVAAAFGDSDAEAPRAKLPSTAPEEDVVRPGTDEDVITHDESAKKPPKKTKRTFGAMSREDYDAEVLKDQSEWVPPSNQTGDGRTSLNAKFGY